MYNILYELYKNYIILYFLQKSLKLLTAHIWFGVSFFFLIFSSSKDLRDTNMLVEI